MLLEIGEGAMGAGEGFRGAEEDSVYAADVLAGYLTVGFWGHCTQMRMQSWELWAGHWQRMSVASEGAA